VLGRPTTGLLGTITGYHRYCVKGEYFPAISKKEGSTVDGMLIYGLSDDDINKLDAFETGYVRIKVPARQASDGVVVDAFTYLWNGNEDDLHGSWVLEEFEPNIQNFLDSEYVKEKEKER